MRIESKISPFHRLVFFAFDSLLLFFPSQFELVYAYTDGQKIFEKVSSLFSTLQRPRETKKETWLKPGRRHSVQELFTCVTRMYTHV